MKAIGYIRVSTTTQAEMGHSLAEQKERLEMTALAHGIDELVLVEDSGASAASLNRKGISDVMDLIAEGGTDYVMVTALDRITRSVSDLDTLVRMFQKHGVEFISAGESLNTSTAAGRMVLFILGSVAQWEREAISERTRHVQQSLRAMGRAIGPPPYGYATDTDRFLVPHPVEQSILEIMKDLRADGMSYSAIAQSLASRGLVNRNGKNFSRQSVHRILKNQQERQRRTQADGAGEKSPDSPTR